MAAETQYTANTGIVIISTANSNLDGSTGTYGTVITAGSSGTLIKTVTIKAQGNTSHGMVRLFAYDNVTTKLIYEAEVPAVTKAAMDPSFEISIPLNYHLEASGILKASTENADTFNVIAEGLDWTYYSAMVRPESANYTANTAMATISTANAGLDGSGTLGTILTAGSNGTLVQSIVIKAQVSTTLGMIRLFLTPVNACPGGTCSNGVCSGGANAGLPCTFIFMEIRVPAVTKSGTAHSFSHRIDFGGRDFALKSGWVLKASTQNGEAFNIIAEGLDWAYPA